MSCNAVAGSNHCPIKSHGEQLRSPAYCILRSNLSGGVLDTLETTAAASLLDPHASIVGLTFGTLPSKDILEPRFNSLCGLIAQRQANTRSSSTTSSSRDPSEVYWKENKLDFDDKIGELFYDCGRDRASTATALPTLMSLRALDARVAGREVLLVNSATDLDFRSFVDLVYAQVFFLGGRERAVKLAEMVVDRLSAPGMAHVEVNPCYSSQDTIVIPIGAFTKGVCRHRALLFKAVADVLPAGSSVTSRLIRGGIAAIADQTAGDTTATHRLAADASCDFAIGGVNPHAWNVVL
ncbi:hypothetical protein WJX84_003078 [Apatococcus fuscideae]|uniref:EDR1/CTR1/ARMC3-like peptidase-like domain-containing protein n=1 Tax=Apatococcus fuscideae TaxID=2026836 RepID=A0AAW1SPW1_9CHLO